MRWRERAWKASLECAGRNKKETQKIGRKKCGKRKIKKRERETHLLSSQPFKKLSPKKKRVEEFPKREKERERREREERWRERERERKKWSLKCFFSFFFPTNTQHMEIVDGTWWWHSTHVVATNCAEVQQPGASPARQSAQGTSPDVWKMFRAPHRTRS